jgi:hypothetical protein
MKSKKYLLLCNRHSSVHGDEWGLFWGCRVSKSGYNSDLRTAHRFTEEEIERYKDGNEDIPIPIDILGISEECESEDTYNKNIRVLIEKGTLNELLHLDLKKDTYEDETEEDCCPVCGSENIGYSYYHDCNFCKDCGYKFEEDEDLEDYE